MKKLQTNYWKGKKVVVTGGAGFLGTHLLAKLKARGAKDISVPRSADYDLRTKEACAQVVKGADIVIHLAANVGGIGYNREFPGTLFYDNLLMGVHLMEESRGVLCPHPCRLDHW